MAALNKYAADAVRNLDGVHACTDVTGFSLLGHSYEMCGESGLTVIIDSSRVPLLPGADSYASMGLVPAVAYQNMNHLKDKVALPKDLPSHVHDLLFDPQTSGGLLYSVASQEAGRIMEALQKAGSGQPAPFHSATFSTFLNILTADQQAAKELSDPHVAVSVALSSDIAHLPFNLFQTV